MTSIKLRDYQVECLASIQENYANGINRQLVSVPTGAGKTVIFSELIKQMKRRTLVLAHTTELLDQAKEKIQMICSELDVGLVKADRKEFDRPVVVSSIQSARQPEVLEQLKGQGFSLCIYDEAHRSASKTPREILSELGFFSTGEKLLVGLTATPFRNDSKGLGEVFEKLTYSKTIKDLINHGYLCKPIGIRIKSDLDLSTVATENGDFKTDSLASVMDTPEMIDLVVDSWLENAQGKKTIAFGVTISHAQNLAEAFRGRGINAASVSGTTPDDERKKLLAMFKNGDITVLANCMILTEGYDEASIEAVIMARPTQSKGLYTQMVGRGLRLFINKPHCKILDFGSQTHSLCGMAELLKDSDEEESKEKPQLEGKLSEFVKSLPPSINKKLRASIIEFDLLGDSFTWLKDGYTYSLKAIENKTLKIFPTAEGRYSVLFFDGNSYQTIAEKLSFEFAFCCAEEFAKENRAIFSVSDLDAPWRQLPISQKQKDLFRSYRYSSGIDDLSRGQAALIISSGILNKRAVQK
jgi:superfamily II DNA or RNA helicase